MSAFPLPAPAPAPGPRLAKVRDVRSTATAEMLAFPARWLGRLPAPPALRLHVAGVPGVVAIAPSAGSAAGAQAGVVFSAEEWSALCRGVEADRIWAQDLAAICARKVANPSYRLELEDALAGARVDDEQRWSLARVLRRVDAQLLDA